MSEETKKYSYMFDHRFLQVIELSIMGAVDGKSFGDVFRSFHTVEGVDEMVATINTPKLAILFDHLIRLFTNGNAQDHENILAHLRAFQAGQYKAQELFHVVDSNGKTVKL